MLVRTLTSLSIAVGLALSLTATAEARAVFGGLRWADRYDVSPPLSTMAPVVATPQADVGPASGGGFVGPIQSFDGISNDENARGSVRLPPDANGAVGPRNYVQWVNKSIAVYDKLGHRLLGPVSGNVVWRGFGGPCEASNEGDPIVLYDRFADRWLLAQLGSPAGPHRLAPFVECVAVSTTPDPTGAYYRYAFVMPSELLNDYPKLAVWPDTYTMTDRRDSATGAEQGEDVFALDRSAMLTGRPPGMLWYKLDASGLGLLPVDDDGPALPSPGQPALFVRVAGGGQATDPGRLELFQLHADFVTRTNSAFNGPTPLPTDPFDPVVCASDTTCIQQPGTAAGSADGLDPISDRLMPRASYRIVDGVPLLVVSHTVATPAGNAGIRWYEIRDPSTNPSIAEQGTYAPDGDSRWMGSAALDRLGDLAVGFSVSGPSTFPSIGFAGRRHTDPPSTLPLDEGRLATGRGAQAGFAGHWGDYSSLVVDPVDGCTFWYTQEYYPAPGGSDWHTRIGSFRFPGCGQDPTIAGFARNGDTLTAAMPIPSDVPNAQVAYQWRRCDADGANCADIAGATGAHHAVGSDDEGSTLRVATVSSDDASLESGLSAATAFVPVVPAAGPVDLGVTMTAMPTPVLPGADVTYVIRVSNASGGGTATGVRVTNDLPGGAALVSATADSGGCAAGPPVVCDLGFLIAGRAATVTVVVRPAGRGTFSDVATVTADQADPAPSSNRAAASVDVRAAPRVALVGAPPVVARVAGQTIAAGFRFTVDEPVRLSVSVAGSRGTLPLLPGSVAGDVRSGSPHWVLVGSVAAPGRSPVVLRLAPPVPHANAPYAIRLRATDRDGLTTVLVLPLRFPTRHG